MLMSINEIRWFYWSICKNLRNFFFNENRQNSFWQKRVFLKITLVQILSTKMKLGSWNFSFLMVLKMLGTDFWIFDFFYIITKILGKIGKMSEIWDIMRQISKKIRNSKFQAFLEPKYRGTSRHNFSSMASFLWIEFVPA